MNHPALDGLGTELVFYEVDGSAGRAIVSDEPRIDAAVSEFLHSGRDSLIDITRTNGMLYRILASRICAWQVSTPEGRRAQAAIDRAAREEARANSVALGDWSGDDDA